MLPGVPVGVGRATRSHDGGTCCRDHDLVAQPETELALEHVPRLVVRMVDVEGSDPVLADLGDPLDQDEVLAGDPGGAKCKSLGLRHAESMESVLY